MASTIDNPPNTKEPKMEKESQSRIPYLKKKRSGSKTMTDTTAKHSIKDTFKERLRRFSTKKNHQETAKVVAAEVIPQVKEEVASDPLQTPTLPLEATKDKDNGNEITEAIDAMEPEQEYIEFITGNQHDRDRIRNHHNCF
jgi:hypothetical protein